MTILLGVMIPKALGSDPAIDLARDAVFGHPAGQWLRAVGFDVRTIPRYHAVPLPAQASCLTAASRVDTLRIVARIQSKSALEQLDPARAAVVAIRLGDVMGLMAHRPGTPVDADRLARLAAAARRAGIAEGIGVSGPMNPHRLLEALEASSLPEREINRLAAIFGPSRLAELASVSEPSLRRYAAGERSVPDPVAQRLHFLAVLVAILGGSFNEFGIRRWFDRPRQALGGRTPARALGGDWAPDDPGPEATLRLAVELLI